MHYIQVEENGGTTNWYEGLSSVLQFHYYKNTLTYLETHPLSLSLPLAAYMCVFQWPLDLCLTLVKQRNDLAFKNQILPTVPFRMFICPNATTGGHSAFVTKF